MKCEIPEPARCESESRRSLDRRRSQFRSSDRYSISPDGRGRDYTRRCAARRRVFPQHLLRSTHAATSFITSLGVGGPRSLKLIDGEDRQAAAAGFRDGRRSRYSVTWATTEGCERSWRLLSSRNIPSIAADVIDRGAVRVVQPAAIPRGKNDLERAVRAAAYTLLDQRTGRNVDAHR